MSARTDVRVMVASESEAWGDKLASAVEQAGGTVVCRARNAIEAMARARVLKPEVSIVDVGLPYSLGRDDVRMSRMSGLDTAMNIVRDAPDSNAVVVNSKAISDAGEDCDSTPVLCRQAGGGCVPFDARELRTHGAAEGRVIFAEFLFKNAPLLSCASRISHQLFAAGGLFVLCGMALMMTLVLVTAGVAVVGLGLFILLGAAIAAAVARIQPKFA